MSTSMSTNEREHEYNPAINQATRSGPFPPPSINQKSETRFIALQPLRFTAPTRLLPFFAKELFPKPYPEARTRKRRWVQDGRRRG